MLQHKELILRAALRLVGLYLFVSGSMATVEAFLVYLQAQESFPGMRLANPAGVYGILHAMVPLVTGALLFKMAAVLTDLVFDDPAEFEPLLKRLERIQRLARDSARRDGAGREA